MYDNKIDTFDSFLTTLPPAKRISPFWEDIWIDKIAHWSPDAVQRLLRVRFGLTRMRYWFLFWYIGFLRFKKYLNGASKTTRWLLSSK
jgi:hypothetical protein